MNERADAGIAGRLVVPMDGGEDRPLAARPSTGDAQQRRAVGRGDPRQPAVGRSEAGGIRGMYAEIRLRHDGWPSRGESPVRVIVCHWSRMRPVLRISG